MRTIIIDFPLRGEWVYLKPPGHHKFAFDFVKVGKNQKRYSNGSFFKYLFGKISAIDFYCWSMPIFAPVDGVVLQASDGWQDNRSVNLINTIIIWFRATFLFRPKINDGNIDIRPNAGNFVMIKTNSGEIVFMAHMRNGSLKVVTGQQVVAGQAIGDVENSGNTTEPHLHINLFDQMDNPLKAKVIQFAFSEFKKQTGNLWIPVRNDVPKTSGETIRAVPN